MPDLAERISPLQSTAVNAVLTEVKALQAHGRQLVSLMRGEPDFRTPEHIVDAAVKAVRDGRTGYPDNRGEMNLRRAVEQKLTRENGIDYDPVSEILITDGATMGIYAALMALINPGDAVMLPDPVYDAYQSPIRLAGGVIVRVPARLENGRFYLDPEALEAAWNPQVKVLILNTPWNPAGTVFSPPEVAQIAEFVIRHDMVLISDEIYEWITYDGNKHVSPVEIARDLRERCILVNSFSKTYAMTGWRLGYCAGPKEIIHGMFMILAQASRGPATFIQDAGVEALSGSQACVDEMRAAYTQRRALVLETLAGLPRVHAMPPEGGFFSMVDIREKGVPSNEARKRLLNENGVVVIHGAAYGAGGEGTLRVSFASGGNQLVTGLDLLRQGLSSL
jgi:aspartate/methionine/tyrosine aminotransferase